jgi:outer membrane protein
MKVSFPMQANFEKVLKVKPDAIQGSRQNATSLQKLAGAALFATTGFLGVAPTAFGTELTTAWEQARNHDAQLKASQAQITAAKERTIQANSANGLNVSANASAIESLTDTNKTANNFSFNPSIGAQLSYPLYRPQNLANIESSKLQLLLSETQLAQTEMELMVRVSQAYFDVLAAQDSIALLRAQKRAISEQLASAKRNFEVGTATITDQQEAQARFDLVIAQEIAAENDLDVKKAALATLTGQATEKVRGLAAKNNALPNLSEPEAQWVNQAAESSFPVRLSKVATELAKREIDRSVAAKKPTVDVISNIGLARSSSTISGLISRSASAGIQMTVPIFNGGALDSRQREAIALLDKAENELLANQRVAVQASRSVYKKLSSGIAQVKALQQAEKSSQLALDSNQLGYQVGVRINIDVLNAQQQLFSTQRDLARARYEILLDNLRLRQAVGTLNATDLKAVSALLTEER